MPKDPWLKRYYFARAAFSITWVAAAIIIGRESSMAAALLLAIYPAWDAIANVVDAQRSGASAANITQKSNAAISALATVAITISLGMSMYAALGVFGAWAVVSGALQLATAFYRWRSHGAQWAMILSGAQSMLAGGFFVYQANGTKPPTIADIAPYAAFGAFYFLVSAISLTISDARRK